MTSAATFCLAEGEGFKKCPYDEHHVVLNTKFMSHLVKCRKRYLAKHAEIGIPPPYAYCRYNSFHKYIFPELLDHEMDCPDRLPAEFTGLENLAKQPQANGSFEEKLQKIVENSSLRIENGDEKKKQAANKINHQVVWCDEDEEDWELNNTGKVFEINPYQMETFNGSQMIWRNAFPGGLAKSERRQLVRDAHKKFKTVKEVEEEESEIAVDSPVLVWADNEESSPAAPEVLEEEQAISAQENEDIEWKNEETEEEKPKEKGKKSSVLKWKRRVLEKIRLVSY